MSGPKMFRAQGSGVEIQMAEWPGMGEPILAVHGLTANCRSFDTLAAGLSPAHRFLAMDLRGRGLSDKPSSGYSLEHHGRDIEQILAALELESVTLMGHSLGAYISLALAAKKPKLVKKLVLIDGGANLTPEQWGVVSAGIKPSLDRLGQVFLSFEAYLEKVKPAPFLQPWNQATEDYFRYESETVENGVRSRINPENIAEERANMATLDPAKLYPKITCPVLILRATDGMLGPDQLVLPKNAANNLIDSLNRAEMVELPGSNHFSIIFQPNQTRDKAVLEFMKRAD